MNPAPKLTPRMLAVLASVAGGEPDDEPLPPANTVAALLRRGLIELVDDPGDPIARMLGLVQIRPTEAGRAALERADG